MNKQSDFKLNICKTDKAFEDFLSYDFITEESREKLKKANLILLPRIKEKKPYFEVVSEDLFYYLKENETDKIKVDICITEEQFQFIREESIDVFIELGIFLLLELAIKPFIERIINFFKKRKEKKELVRLKLLVEKTENKVIYELEYQGPVEGIEQILEKLEGA